MAHENVSLIEKGYQLFQSGDLDNLLELFADDIMWHVPGDNPLSGQYQGKQQVTEQVWTRFITMTDETLNIEVNSIEADEYFATAFVRVSASRLGRSLEKEPAVQIFRLVDGKIVEVWTRNHNQAKIDSFFSEAKEMTT